MARDPRQHLAAMFIRAEKAWRARPARLLKEGEQLVYERAGFTHLETNRVTNPYDRVDVSATEALLGLIHVPPG